MANGKPKYRIKKDVRPRKGNVLGQRGQAIANQMAGLKPGKQGAPAHNIGRLTTESANLLRHGAPDNLGRKAKAKKKRRR